MIVWYFIVIKRSFVEQSPSMEDQMWPLLTTAPGSTHFKAYKSLVQVHTSDIIPIGFNVKVVNTDNNVNNVPSLEATISACKGEPLTSNMLTQESYQPSNLARDHLQQTKDTTGNQEEIKQNANPTTLMLKVHYKLGHLPFSKSHSWQQTALWTAWFELRVCRLYWAGAYYAGWLAHLLVTWQALLVSLIEIRVISQLLVSSLIT